MTLDSLIAILALLLAAYSIMPRHRQLDLLLRLRWHDWLAIAVTLLLTHYLLFFDFFRQIGLTPALGLYRYGITPKDAAYLLLVMLGLYIGFALRFFKLSPKRVDRFQELVDALLWSNHHRELIGLLERHLSRLLRISKNDFFASRLANDCEATRCSRLTR